MGGGRNTKHYQRLPRGERGGRIIGHGDGGGGSNTNRLAVFEFAADDERVEEDSCCTLSKFRSKTPPKKHANHHSLDKYTFLSSFARGSRTPEHNFGTKPSIVDVCDDFLKDETVIADVLVLDGCSSSRSWRECSQNHCDSKFFAEEEKLYRYGKETAKKNKKENCRNSSDGGMMEMRSAISFDLAASGGSLQEPSSEHEINANDCEAVVVVAPNYVKYRSIYYTKCLLTFSCWCIRLEGSSLSEKRNHYRLEWAINDIMKIEYKPCESVEADFMNLQFKLKDANVSGACNLNSEILELEFVVLGVSQRSQNLEEIKSLDPKYEAAWKTVTPVYTSNVAFEGLIYPKGDPDAVFISKKDVDLLQPRTFINDTIIDFYIKYLLTISVEQHRFHAFNTFFFRKLADLDQDPSRIWDGKEAFRRVWKWTRNVNLFEKDYILIPVNFSLHWSLIVICHPGKVANLKEEDMGNSSEMPCILHMDSIQGSHRGFGNLIQSYLWEEWKERHNNLEADMSLKFLNLPLITLQLPQQENFFDCGVFLLHYAEQFLELATSFRTRKYADLLNKDLFLPAEVSLKKRDHIRNLIYRIVGDETWKDPLAVSDDTCLPGDNSNEGDSSVQFVKETSVKDMINGKKLDSSVDQQIHETSICNSRQQSSVQMLEPNHIAKSLSDDGLDFCEQLVSNKEESYKSLATYGLPYATSSREADGGDISLLSACPVGNFSAYKAVECGLTTSTAVPRMKFDMQNDEDYVLEIKSNLQKEKNECDCSSQSSEILQACVSDSDEENETKSIIRKQMYSP